METVTWWSVQHLNIFHGRSGVTEPLLLSKDFGLALVCMNTSVILGRCLPWTTMAMCFSVLWWSSKRLTSPHLVACWHTVPYRPWNFPNSWVKKCTLCIHGSWDSKAPTLRAYFFVNLCGALLGKPLVRMLKRPWRGFEPGIGATLTRGRK